MNLIDQAVKHIRSLLYARVDNNYGQGAESILNQVKTLESDNPEEVDQIIAYSKECLVRLEEMFLPHQLPSDYLYFLEHYGGLIIEKPGDDNSFNIYGIGPAVNIWYAHVEESNILSENYLKKGFLSIGTLNLGNQYKKYHLSSNFYKHIHYYLSSSGNVYEEGVFLSGNKFERDELRMIASSFTEWLNAIPSLYSTIWQV